MGGICRDCQNTVDLPQIITATKKIFSLQSTKSVSRMGTISLGNLFRRRDTILQSETRTGVWRKTVGQCNRSSSSQNQKYAAHTYTVSAEHISVIVPRSTAAQKGDSTWRKVRSHNICWFASSAANVNRSANCIEKPSDAWMDCYYLGTLLTVSV